MDSHGEFCPARGWYQAVLIDRVFDELEMENPPEESSLKRHLARWVPEWRTARKKLRTKYAPNAH